MNVWKKLQNPFALVVQGFVVGGMLFWTTQGRPPAPLSLAAAAIIRSEPSPDALERRRAPLYSGAWFAFRSAGTS